MSMKCEEVSRKIEEIKRELEQIYILEKKFPKGELLCAQNGKHYKWYVREQNDAL